MTDTSTEVEYDTSLSILEEYDYLAPISLYICDDGMVKYRPVHYEKDLVMYDLSVSQCKYPDGRYGELRINVKIDGSKNVINDRFEILDL